MKNSTHKFNFFALATGLILLAGLCWVALQPSITAWRWQIVDKLVSRAEASNDQRVKLAVLQQASLIGGKDPVATAALAKFWQDRGELSKAVLVYKYEIAEPNYAYLANMSLKAQDYKQALSFAKKANKAEPTASGLLAEANAQFNIGNIAEGCELATKAYKLDLKNQSSVAALHSCKILGGNPGESYTETNVLASSRENSYHLINNFVFVEGEKRLQDEKDKTANDYLLLARLSSARGELEQAVDRVEQGLSLDQSNTGLNELAVVLYNQKGDKRLASLHELRLQQLKFANYQ